MCVEGATAMWLNLITSMTVHHCYLVPTVIRITKFSRNYRIKHGKVKSQLTISGRISNNRRYNINLIAKIKAIAYSELLHLSRLPYSVSRSLAKQHENHGTLSFCPSKNTQKKADSLTISLSQLPT